MKYENIREEELKNRVAKDYFWLYDCTKIIGNVDFCVSMQQTQQGVFEQTSLLWAEAKKGSSNIYNSLVQLIITIGKGRTFDKQLPPPYLGAFDSEKIAFVPYNEIHDIFYLNDFNWNVAPSNYETKEFKIVYDKVKQILDTGTLIFKFERDDKDLSKFIRLNFLESKRGISKIKIDKNNFIIVYNKWLIEVKPSISVNWDLAKNNGVIDGDFYLADLLSAENYTLKDKLFVILKSTQYILNRHHDEYGAFTSSSVEFTDKQVAHTQFWNKYERPPKEEYWDYIVERRDLLVPQDVRERKGSFFTPQIWVELSQKYLADVLGENWQDEFYVWDCAAGTGNLLTGLTNKYSIWASTLDKQDVAVMHERIDTMNTNSVNGNGANLLKDHVFQFDFLNDDFSKLPKSLLEVINDTAKRKRLVIYINPPYAEHGNRSVFAGEGEHKSNVATSSKVYHEFQNIVGTATRELYIQFFLKVFKEIPDSNLASFSTLKFISSPNFAKFRNYFKGLFRKGFICKANTFDNVSGQFPIGFLIWKINPNTLLNTISVDIFNEYGNIIGEKTFRTTEKNRYFINWFRPYINRDTNELGSLHIHSNDIQQQNVISITSIPTKSDLLQKTFTYITSKNLFEVCIYYAVRHCIEATWLNNRDQYLYPDESWDIDKEFHTDCLSFTLFSNNIQSKIRTNHWIPFTEYEVGARDNFESNYMSNFINGKESDTSNFIVSEPIELYGNKKKKLLPLEFSPEAKAVFDSGRRLWQYYHSKPKVNINASLYEIREYFQGRNEKGKMNNRSADEQYNLLILDLRKNLKLLARKIESKVYFHGFLQA